MTRTVSSGSFTTGPSSSFSLAKMRTFVTRLSVKYLSFPFNADENAFSFTPRSVANSLCDLHIPRRDAVLKMRFKYSLLVSINDNVALL